MIKILFNMIVNFIIHPYPLRTIVVKTMRKLRIGKYEYRLNIGAVERPYYGYCIYNAAVQAKKLGIKRISVIEFGVAGGRGLINMEYHANEITRLLNVEIDIYGFDTGKGLPPPKDYRDLPYHFDGGFYKIDIERLNARLGKAKLVLGDIENTSKEFFNTYTPAPIGAIAYDLDYYSSTTNALKMLEAGDNYYLPRIFCYFDNTIGKEDVLYNEYTGERLAINDFNKKHKDIKLAFPYYLLGRKPVEPWYYKIWICHFFNHNRYNEIVNKYGRKQLPLER